MIKAVLAVALFGAAVLLARWLITAAPAPETGQASFYGGRSHGRKMANGERFDKMSDSCAHRQHPFGTRLRVSAGDGRSVTCVVRDRGPFVAGRIVDLSVAGARALGIERSGTADVTVRVVR